MFVSALFMIVQEWKQSKCPLLFGMYQQIVVQPDNRISFVERNDTETCYDMDEPGKHDAT